MSKKNVPVFKFTDGSQPNVTWYTSEEYKAIKNNKQSIAVKEQVNSNTENETYKDILNKLLKECKTKNGYIGVEYENLTPEEGETKTEVLFNNILVEMETLSVYAHEYVRDEYDTELPFKSEYNAKQHVKRLGNFVVKYAPSVLNKDEADQLVKEAQAYL